MKRRVIILTSIVLLLTACETESNTEMDFDYTFLKTYGLDGDQQAVDMLVNEDGTILLLGNSSNERDGSQVYLVKTDSTGRKLWSQLYGTGSDYAVDIERAMDGVNVVILSNTIVSETDTDIRLTEISPETGEVIDEKTSGYINSYDEARSITAMSNGTYWVTGLTNEQQTGTVRVPFVFKFNSDFTEPSQYAKTILYEGASFECGIKIIEEPIGVYNLFSYVTRGEVISETDLNFSISKVSEDLGRTGGFAYPTDDDGLVNNTLSQVHYIPGKGYALIGTAELNASKNVCISILGSLPADLSNTTIFKYNDGNETPTLSTLQGNFEGISITHTADNNFLALVNQEITIISGVARNVVLVKLNSQGNPIWETSFGSTEFEDLSAKVVELPSGKILVFGTFSIGGSQEKMGLIKLNSKGEFLK